MSDARFEDAQEAALHLKAVHPDDLTVVSALAQDGVFPASDIRWEAKRRRFTILLNRFRWEDAPAAERRKRPFERVRALLVAENVVHVASQGVDRKDQDTVFSLLSISWEAGEDGTGRLLLTLAGDGAIALDVECLDLTLKDVTKPYAAPSRKAPTHPEE